MKRPDVQITYSADPNAPARNGWKPSLTPPDAPPEPTTLELAANFGGAMAGWARAGFATVSAETYAARAEACDRCPLWDGAARGGLGKCRACGCTGLKRWLVTAKCPHPAGPRWPS